MLKNASRQAASRARLGLAQPRAFQFVPLCRGYASIDAGATAKGRAATATSASVPSVVVTRFAPSPTGFLHLGGFRTALFNYLYARKFAGVAQEAKFLLRIEDTDQKRLVEESVAQIESIMRWAGMDYDAKYVQSERTETYRKYANELLERGEAYKCYCSHERLERLREEGAKKGLQSKYDRHCLNLSDEERRKLDEQKAPFSIRMKIPHADESAASASSKRHSTIIEDVVFGRIVVPNDTIDDQILLKSDGFPTYHLANIVDDHEMGVTHVIRGMEWISSTAKHLLLYRAFGWQAPTFAHLPLLTTEDGQKLSKRIGHASVDWYKQQGFLPEALVNFVAYLGWSPAEAEKSDVHTLDELVRMFDLSRVNKGNCTVNLKKLEWMNAEHIRMKIDRNVGEVMEAVRPRLRASLPAHVPLPDDAYLERVLRATKERIKKYDYFADYFYYYFTEVDFERPEAREFKLQVDKVRNGTAVLRFLRDALAGLEPSTQFVDASIGVAINTAKDNADLGKPTYKDIVQLLRYYLTGSHVGAGINQTIEALGRDTVLRRLDAGLRARTE